MPDHEQFHPKTSVNFRAIVAIYTPRISEMMFHQSQVLRFDRARPCTSISSPLRSIKRLSTINRSFGADKAASESLSSEQGAMQTEWKWEQSDDSVKSYAALASVLAIGAIPQVQTNAVADLPYFISLAICTLYIGSHKALTTDQRQMINMGTGAFAPVAASISLFGIYLLLKYLPDLDIQTLLNAYFFLLGSFAVSSASVPLFRKVFSDSVGRQSIHLDLPEGLLLDQEGKSIKEANIAPSDLVAVMLSLAIAGIDVTNSQNFTANNLLAALIASDILQLVGLRSFRTAGLMLGGLCAYDIFWVFGSPSAIGENVMMKVATSDIITGPMRLLYPRLPGGTGEAADFPFSLLGLGDIAVPGLLACLALRYDSSRVVDMKSRADAAGHAMLDALAALGPTSTGRERADAASDAASLAYDRVADKEGMQRDLTVTEGSDGGSRVSVSEAVLQQRPYFSAVVVSYIIGLLMAFAANNITHLGQPALLYIVPMTLGSVLVTAAQRDEIYRIWTFTDVPSFGMPEERLRKADELEKNKQGNLTKS
jgi:minor histocompatibility antigen H13